MKKSGRRASRRKTAELEPYDRRRVDVARFKPDLSPKRLAGLFGLEAKLSFLTIDILGIARTVGRGRTNLTFIRPTIVQADAATPFASFDRQLSGSRKPAISMHFEPGAYGITSNSSFLMTFAIECSGQTTFDLEGFAGSGTLENAGIKVLSGKTRVTLGFHNVPPSQQTFGFLEQQSGAPWNFFSVEARFPFPIVLEPLTA